MTHKELYDCIISLELFEPIETSLIIDRETLSHIPSSYYYKYNDIYTYKSCYIRLTYTNAEFRYQPSIYNNIGIKQDFMDIESLDIKSLYDCLCRIFVDFDKGILLKCYRNWMLDKLLNEKPSE